MVSPTIRKNLTARSISHFRLNFNDSYLFWIYSIVIKFLYVLTVSSIFIAINCFLLVYFSFLLYDINIDLNLLVSSFLLTFTVYGFDKIANIKEDLVGLPERAGFIGKYKKSLTYITVASYLTALFLSYLRNPLAIIVILFPLLTGLIYSIKILNFRLKDITGIKNISVALSWAVVGAFIPISVSYRNVIQIILIFYFIFIKLFINSTLFDVRDIKGDRMNGVRTIPVYLGLMKTRKLLIIFNTTLVVWLIYLYSQGFFHKYLIVLIFNIFFGYWYILYFCQNGLEIGKSLDLLVDGEWIPTAIIALMMS